MAALALDGPRLGVIGLNRMGAIGGRAPAHQHVALDEGVGDQMLVSLHDLRIVGQLQEGHVVDKDVTVGGRTGDGVGQALGAGLIGQILLPAVNAEAVAAAQALQLCTRTVTDAAKPLLAGAVWGGANGSAWVLLLELLERIYHLGPMEEVLRATLEIVLKQTLFVPLEVIENDPGYLRWQVENIVHLVDDVTLILDDLLHREDIVDKVIGLLVAFVALWQDDFGACVLVAIIVRAAHKGRWTVAVHRSMRVTVVLVAVLLLTIHYVASRFRLEFYHSDGHGF